MPTHKGQPLMEVFAIGPSRLIRLPELFSCLPEGHCYDGRDATLGLDRVFTLTDYGARFVG
jgi:hypothetical protein